MKHFFYSNGPCGWYAATLGPLQRQPSLGSRPLENAISDCLLFPDLKPQCASPKGGIKKIYNVLPSPALLGKGHLLVTFQKGGA